MGSLISSHIANLIGGVSQQPWAVRMPTQCEEQVNCYGTAVDFLRRRPSTKHVANLPNVPSSGNVAVHGINRDETERYIVTTGTNGSIYVSDLFGNLKTVSMKDNSTAYLQCSHPKKDLRFLTLNDYTIILNRKSVVKMQAATTAIRVPEALVFIKQANYNTTYRLGLNGAWGEFLTESGVTALGSPPHELDSSKICEALKEKFSSGEWNIQISQSTMWIKRIDGQDFTIQVGDSRSDTHVVCAKERVQRFSDLPTCAPKDFVLEVTGDSNSSFDNYYVKFKPANASTVFDEGVWEETVKPGIKYRLDASTMPHALIRQADGTFICETIKDWGERICGDEDSAPEPTFVGRPIRGIFFYRNRLSFLSWENVIMSKTGEFFNFFVSTVTTLLDNDVIDVAASHYRPPSLEHAAVFSGGLLLFSEGSQFTLEHDTILSNATASVKPITEFEASMQVAPVSSGKTVFFATDKGKWGGVREYFTLPDASEQNDAAEVSAHIPRYIEGSITDMVCSPGEDIVLLQTAEKPNSVWVYKYFWNGSEKIQSSWSRWDMCGEVLGMVMINTTSYFIMRYAGGSVCIEAVEFESKHKDPFLDFEVCLDRKITNEQLVMHYDAHADATTVTLPYVIDVSKPWLFLVRPTGPEVQQGAEYKPGTLIPSTIINSNTITIPENCTNLALYGGVPYRSEYSFSPFALRDGQNRAVVTGRLQLRSLTLVCQDTGHLEILVTPLYRQTSRHVFTGRRLGHGSNILGAIPIYEGDIRVPLLSRNTQLLVTVQSESWLPFTLINASWEGFYNSRSNQA